MFELLWFLAVLLVANVAEKMRSWRVAAWALLLITNLLAMGLGLLTLLLGQILNTLDAAMLDTLPPNVLFFVQPTFALILFATGCAGMLVLLPPVRRGVAPLLRAFDPENMVHITALMFSVYVVGVSLAQILSGIGDLLQTLDASVSLLTVWAQGVVFVLFAFLGVGLFVRRSWRETLHRLGLERPTGRQIVLAVGIMLLLQVLDTMIVLLWQWLDPQGFEALNESFMGLIGGLMNVAGALSIGLTAGIGEELLFRGALQPRFGLLPTAVLFSLLHVQYGLSPAMLEVFVIALVLGVVRDRTNTTTVILVHALYNTLNVLLMSLLYSV
ncbi:hypothetical protein ARMA_0498 [Ardenticatena maritima]|uniref:CAAX prenyl protease 2/Lysostaphin resistance protein A-like domain-containing protein n=1 Tax=Ardenticatena maritima TaxID=872965 RepID=A0A0M8K5H0_9CHLR|nr:CPBP family intramembrane glutamic endopeptidase [Ardenticatena maritima]GAP62075.1 hypothetical protein ARMA_0498 [Ardenticatena maritima]